MIYNCTIYKLELLNNWTTSAFQEFQLHIKSSLQGISSEPLEEESFPFIEISQTAKGECERKLLHC